MSRRRHEFPELPIGNGRAIDPELADGDAVDRRFLGIVLLRPHSERAARNPDHVGGLDALRLGQITRHPKARLGFRPRVLAHVPMLRADATRSSWTVVQ
jgi:hypothetical protein